MGTRYAGYEATVLAVFRVLFFEVVYTILAHLEDPIRLGRAYRGGPAEARFCPFVQLPAVLVSRVGLGRKNKFCLQHKGNYDECTANF